MNCRSIYSPVSAVALALSFAFTCQMAAQESEGARVISVRRTMPAWLGGTFSLHVAPELQFRAGGLVGDASALFGGGRQTPSRLETRATAALGIPTISSLRFESEVGAFRTGGGPDIRARGLEGTVRFMRQDNGGMVWIGGTLTSSWDDETNRRARTLSGGVWKALGQSGVGVSMRAVEYDEEIILGRDTIYEVLGFPFRSERAVQIVYDYYYLDAEFVASHRIGPVALHLDWGGRLTRRAVNERRIWARGGVEIPVLDDVTFQIAVGTRPNMPEYRIEAGSFASVGVKLELGKRGLEEPMTGLADTNHDAPSSDLRALRDLDTWELLVWNLAGQRAEIMGDPTNWQIVPLHSVAKDTWRVVLRLSPGTHRVNIRIDGGSWRALPGYPTAPDEFGGSVGVIVIEGTSG